MISGQDRLSRPPLLQLAAGSADVGVTPTSGANKKRKFYRAKSQLYFHRPVKEIGRLRQNVGRLSEDFSKAQPGAYRKIPVRNRKFVGRFMVWFPTPARHTLRHVLVLGVSGDLTELTP